MQTRQQELEGAAATFRNQHEERRRLVQQWQEVIETMRSRDVEISDIAKKYAEAENYRKEQLKTLATHRSQLTMLEVRVLSDNKAVIFYFF